MPVEIKKASDLALLHGVKIIVYGEAGAGKTTLIKSLVDPIVISAENGLLSIRDADVDVIEVKTMADFNEAYQFVTSPDSKKYQTVVLDSCSEIAEKILAYEKGQTKDPRQAYGAVIEQVSALVKAFRDLSMKHVVLICKAETYAPDGAVPIIRPSMPGSKLANEMPYLVDEVLRLHVDYDGSRWLQTQPDGTAIAKDRSGSLDNKEPADNGLQHIINKILGI